MKNDIDKNLVPRSPIVVVMGHIDHGKTTLLDFIRKTKIAERESGGITQHIGAYEVEVPQEPKSRESEANKETPRQSRDDFAVSKITFIDTPGHEAFSKMRARGARIADLAILVVAADDGVKAQTIEALAAIKEAKIPFIVAINKIDKETANPERIKNELAQNEIYLEGAGGQVPTVNISAKTGQGITELLELILLASDMEELKADPACPASGVVIESHLDPKRGISAVLIIQNGTLKKKMFVNAGGAIAPIKIFEDFLGKPIDEARFSSPVQITGFDKMPEVGANFRAYQNRQEAEYAKEESRTNCPIAGTFQELGTAKTVLPIIIKADVSGSLEALQKEILKLATEEVAVNILRASIGNLTEDDIKLASSAKNSVVIGFRTKVDASITQMAERMDVALVFFDIIYKLSEWLAEEIKKRTPISATETNLGTAEIIRIFLKEKNKQIIGGKVLTGKIASGKYVKISRRGMQIAKGKILELQHNKIKTSEVEEKEEFGAMVDIKIELAKGDLIEIYDIAADRQI